MDEAAAVVSAGCFRLQALLAQGLDSVGLELEPFGGGVRQQKPLLLQIARKPMTPDKQQLFVWSFLLR